MRSVAPTASGESRSRPARTGRPAWAITAATPTDRKSVLLPDMFDPLTTRARTGPPRLTSFRTHSWAAISGCPRPTALKLGPSVDQLRKRVGRILGGIGRQRAERFELAHRAKPAGDRRPLGAAPGVDRHGKLRLPEQDGGERCEEHVPLRVEQVDPPGQPLDLLRGGPALGLQRLAELPEQRPTETARAPAGRATLPEGRGRARADPRPPARAELVAPATSRTRTRRRTRPASAAGRSRRRPSQSGGRTRSRPGRRRRSAGRCPDRFARVLPHSARTTGSIPERTSAPSSSRSSRRSSLGRSSLMASCRWCTVSTGAAVPAAMTPAPPRRRGSARCRVVRTAIPRRRGPDRRRRDDWYRGIPVR